MSLASGVGMVLGLVGPMGRPWWGSVVVDFYMAVFRIRGALPPLGMGALSLVLIHLVLAVLAFYLKDISKNDMVVISSFVCRL